MTPMSCQPNINDLHRIDTFAGLRSRWTTTPMSYRIHAAFRRTRAPRVARRLQRRQGVKAFSKKTEMKGTGGGRWTTRSDAKRTSRKARRRDDRAAARGA
jgi:hypothetical protein